MTTALFARDGQVYYGMRSSLSNFDYQFNLPATFTKPVVIPDPSGNTGNITKTEYHSVTEQIGINLTKEEAIKLMFGIAKELVDFPCESDRDIEGNLNNSWGLILNLAKKSESESTK